MIIINVMRSKYLYCTLAFFRYLITVNPLFLLFSFITVESAFKMASIQGLLIQSAYV